MRWDPGHRSDDVIDARGQGGFGGMRLGLGGFLVVGVLSLVFHRNLFALFQTDGVAPTSPVATGPAQSTPSADRSVQFVSFVLDDVQATWTRTMPAMGRQYERARLVLFSQSVTTGCGGADSQTGPFYCPADQRVYLDLDFFRALSTRFGAPGDFAQAYVIAHEVGHHVQHLLGIDARVRAGSASQERALSVRLELQADCFAGVWAHSTQQRNILESGDLEEALGAAASVGDDRIQRSAGRRVNPETWTHGSAQQRSAWFRRGWTSGDPQQCNTFGGADPT